MQVKIITVITMNRWFIKRFNFKIRTYMYVNMLCSILDRFAGNPVMIYKQQYLEQNTCPALALWKSSSEILLALTKSLFLFFLVS